MPEPLSMAALWEDNRRLLARAERAEAVIARVEARCARWATMDGDMLVSDVAAVIRRDMRGES